MRVNPENIDQMLPYGELLRGFVTQASVSKGEIKKVLRGRGVFFRNNEKEDMVPCLSALLLSPSEFEALKECQNTREDNLKKSSGRIAWNSEAQIIEVLPTPIEFQNVIGFDSVNYKLTKTPQVVFEPKNNNKATVSFELERYDMNKSWYESTNIFQGFLTIEKFTDQEIVITKSYTSSESEEVANKFQSFLVQHLKHIKVVDKDSELKKILFKDFTNEQRIIFFQRLTSQMDGTHFEFKDIEDIEFRPDETLALPEPIEWMAKKKELILKGSDIHNTFFIKELVYHPHLQFWGLEAKFKYSYSGTNGSCVVNFLFKDFIIEEDDSEFEINISGISPEATNLSQKQKTDLKQKLLELLEGRKNEIYQALFSVHA